MHGSDTQVNTKEKMGNTLCYQKIGGISHVEFCAKK
jgi:hypothetical protein